MQRLSGILISWVLIVLVLAGAGELAVRSFAGVAPAHVRVELDERGFRVDPDIQDPIGAPGVLILGDSVAFGAGVDEPETMIGRLRRARPDRRIYNASSSRHGAADYAETGRRLVPVLPLRDILVVLSLDDVAAGGESTFERPLYF